MFGNLGNLTSMIKQAQQMGAKMNEMSEELKTRRVTGSSGAGMIEVEADGTGEVLAVRIDRQLAEGGDLEMIENLLPAAFNQASEKAKQLHGESMREMTSGLNLPGLDDALAKITGSENTEET